MSLFSNFLWGNKKRDFYENKNLNSLYTKIKNNYDISEKYFERFDLVKQIDLFSILSENRYSKNQKYFLSDFESYIKHIEKEIPDYKVLKRFLNNYNNQQQIEVDSFINGFSDYLYCYDTSKLSPEEYLNLVFVIERISRDRASIEEYLFSNSIVRRLRAELGKNPINDPAFFRTTPIWHSIHMFLDILDSLKKNEDDLKPTGYYLHSYLNTIKNEQKKLIRTFTLLN